MSFEAELKSFSHMVANADLTAKQFMYVKVTGGKIDVCSAITDKIAGVLQNAPIAGEPAVVGFSGSTKVVASAAIAAGSTLGTDAAGKAKVIAPGTDTTQYMAGIADEASNAANGLLSVRINFPSGRAS